MEYKEFKEKYRFKLNEQQDSAVCKANGQTLLLAVPGSGKTTVITAKVGYLIFGMNIAPENILTVTYSVSAAHDMKKRFESIFGENIKTQFRTIHGLCALIIRAYERFNDTTAFELIDKDSKIFEIIKNIYIEMTNSYPADGVIKDIKTQITYAGNMMLNDDKLPDIKFGGVKFAEIYKKFKEYKIKNRQMDFDDQLLFAYRILKTYPNILSSVRNRYRYINVDEAQDTSRIQHEIIRLIVGEKGNIFMVGDEDQSIYGFRAAYPKALLEFKKVYPDGEILLMEKNYRSTLPIIEKADAFIKLNKGRFEKNMQAARQEGECPVLTMLGDIDEQYEYILKKAKESEESFTVLYRNTESVIPLVDMLEKSGVDYQIRENDCVFFSHPIVTDILNILKLAQDPHDVAAFSAVYYKFGCAVMKEKAINACKTNDPIAYLIEKEYDEKKHAKLLALRQALQKACQYDSFYAIKYILCRTGYGVYLRTKFKNETKMRIIIAIAKQNPNLEAFTERLEYLKSRIEKGSKKDAKIILSTVHASKGLEYDNVVIMDTVAGVFPPYECDKDMLEEERRIFYVAVTRAKNKLDIITSAREHGSVINKSSFASEYFSGLETKDKNSSLTREVFKIGSCVRHKMFGRGRVKSIDGNFANIEFDNGAIKKLDMVLCIQNGLVVAN